MPIYILKGWQNREMRNEEGGRDRERERGRERERERERKQTAKRL